MSEQLIPLGKRAEASRPAPVIAPDAPRVYMETYGCQMNVADSDLIGSVLATAGYAMTERADQADVMLINTCAVREKAEDRVIARARELGALKKKRPGAVLAIVGCMAEHLKEGLAERAPAVDVIAGPDSYRRIGEMLAAARTAQAGPTKRQIDVRLDKEETYDGLSGAAGGDGVSGFVTIQRGCDKFCTFCVVPFTRGRERGAPPREVLRQVRELAEAGYREVTLLGQTVNSYRWPDGNEGEVTFAELLRAVAKIDGIERIRFTSPYPVDFTADVIAAIAEEPKVCKYVHLPVQSGSDVVLERMRRGSSRSCTVTSRKKPPEPARNVGSGGVMSRSEVRKNVTSPSSPAWIRDAAAIQSGSGDRVVAVGAAAQGQRRDERVVDVADAPERRGRVDDDAHRLDPAAELLDERVVLRVNRTRVAETIERDHLLGVGQALLGRLGAQHGEHRTQLFACQRLVRTDPADLGEDDRGVGRDSEAGLLRDPGGAAARRPTR